MSKVNVFEPERILSSVDGAKLVCWVSSSLEAGAAVLLIDLHKTSFMDSSGLGALVVALKKVREHRGRLALCSLNGQARMLLEITDMERVFDIYPDRQGFEGSLA